MNRFRFLLIAVVLAPLTGCEWIKNHVGKNDDTPRPTGPLPKAQPDQFVTYLNERAARMQSLNYGDVRLAASDHSVPLPALRGSLAASRPRNFRMTGTGGAVGAKVDLGSNADQFWVYVDAPTMKPTFVFASHSDFAEGKARLPAGIAFEPDWVMQALGMTTLPPNNQYSVKIDDSKRTYTLSWPAIAPNGMSVVKQIVFDGDAATGTKPQVKKHLILDTKGKLICSAEIKRAQTVTLSPTGQPVLTGREPAGTPRPGDQTPAPVAVQHPTLMVLRWEEQKFEMELELKTGKVNDTLTEEQMRRLFTRPNIPGATPIDLAGGAFLPK
jgi:hypothetical protein